MADKISVFAVIRFYMKDNINIWYASCDKKLELNNSVYIFKTVNFYVNFYKIF